MARGRRGGRPGGETSYSGKGLMTRYTRPSSGTRLTMKVSGKKASTNGVKNLKGRASSDTYGGPTSRARKR